MQGDISVFLFSVLLLHGLFTGILVWFWLFNRKTPGLFKLLLACVFGWFGLALAFDSLNGFSAPILIIEYAFLLGSHLFVWLGIASFWQRQTRRLTFFAVVTIVAVYLYEVLYILNGSDLAGRVAIASSYYALSSFGVLLIMMRAKKFNREIYRTAFNQSQLGAFVIAGLFIGHGAFNAYQFLSWEGLGLTSVLGYDAPRLPLLVSLIEALVFTPVFIVGIAIMVTERLQTELRIEQMTDSVTKGLNQRAFMAVSKAILARARRNADAVSLVMIDIANFNTLCDASGRENANSILKQIGKGMYEDRRAQDIFCRFNKSELMLLLPGTAEEGAAQVVARISNSLKNTCKVGASKTEPDVYIASITTRGEDLEIAGMIESVGGEQKLCVLQ